jgi:hypothetical protein
VIMNIRVKIKVRFTSISPYCFRQMDFTTKRQPSLVARPVIDYTEKTDAVAGACENIPNIVVALRKAYSQSSLWVEK